MIQTAVDLGTTINYSSCSTTIRCRSIAVGTDTHGPRFVDCDTQMGHGARAEARPAHGEDRRRQHEVCEVFEAKRGEKTNARESMKRTSGHAVIRIAISC